MQQLRFNIAQALRTISANLLRSSITILIITLGITALVGILTATDVMKSGVSSNFSSMGANSFQVTNEVIRTKKSKKGISRTSTEIRNIRYDDARTFRERYHFPGSKVGLSVLGSMVATVSNQSEKTNPNVRVMGVDQNYLSISQTPLAAGRNISANEDENGSYVCVLGHSVAKKIFHKAELAVNEVVSVGAGKFRVVGVADEKGGSMMMDADNMVLIPLQTARSMYGGTNSFVISVLVSDVSVKKVAGEEAEGLFRVIRKIPLGEENNFSINENDDMVNMVRAS